MTTDLNRVTECESTTREATRPELVVYNEFNRISLSDDSPETRNRPTIGGQSLRLYDTPSVTRVSGQCRRVDRVSHRNPISLLHTHLKTILNGTW